MTHADLVQRACRWLRNTIRCSVVFAEYYGPTIELPDAIGWRMGDSQLVEVKTSRSDFHRDAKKWHRRGVRPSLGRRRWYLTPAGLLTVADLPDGWGLAEAINARSIRIVRQPDRRPPGDVDVVGECAILASAVHRHETGIEWQRDRHRFAPFRDGVTPQTRDSTPVDAWGPPDPAADEVPR